MSNPHAVAEKSVWLENNLTKFFLYGCDKDVLKDVTSIIVARMKQAGIEELYDYLIVHEIEHMDEGQLDKTLKDAGVDTASMVDKVDKMLRVPDAGDILKETIMRNNEIFKAGMKAQKDFDS